MRQIGQGDEDRGDTAFGQKAVPAYVVIGGPVVVARQARVALGDGIGTLLRAQIVVVLIGERPGLSSP